MNVILSKLPEHIDPHSCAQIIQDLTAAVEVLRSEYNNAHRIFLKCTELAVAALDQKSDSYAKDKKALKGRARGLKAVVFDFEEFVRRISWAETENQRHHKNISKIERISRNDETYPATLKDAPEKREKLVQDLFKL